VAPAAATAEAAMKSRRLRLGFRGVAAGLTTAFSLAMSKMGSSGFMAISNARPR
jgi:hypothetical protein